MAETRCWNCDEPIDGEAVIEYVPALKAHVAVHGYCASTGELDEARAEEERREAARERWEDHGVDRAIERRLFGGES